MAMAQVKTIGEATMNIDKYWAAFKNPQTGEPDRLWFETVEARDGFVAGFKSDFPTLAPTIFTWFVSALHDMDDPAHCYLCDRPRIDCACDGVV
jgi:hypothetical protein